MQTNTKENRSQKAVVETTKKTVLVLRTCAADLKSRGGFQWPESGPVQCNDWNEAPVCGNGLHGLLWGEGDGTLLNWSPDAKWLVVKVREDSVVHIDGKVKFPSGEVVFCGDQQTATAYLLQNGALGRSIVGGTSTSGDSGTSTSGHRGTSTSGDYGTSTSGDHGTSTSGENGIILVKWWDEKTRRYRVAVGYPGEDGILPNTKYRADEKGNLVKAD